KIGDLIDSEIKKIIDDCYARAIEVLKSKRDILDNMVKVLYEKETIYTSEVEMLFEGKSAEDVIASIDARQEKNDKYKKASTPKVEIVPEQDKPQENLSEDKIEDGTEDKVQEKSQPNSEEPTDGNND
ncbi:MAG: hypothetical protein ACI4MY_00155, partial [Christensenellales bacterium]